MNSNTPWAVTPTSQSWPQQSQYDQTHGPCTVPPPGLPPGQPPGPPAGHQLGPPPPHSWSDPYSQQNSQPLAQTVASWDPQHYRTPTGPPPVVPAGSHLNSSCPPQSQFPGPPPPPHGLHTGPPPSHPPPVPTLGPQLGLPPGPPPGPPPVPLQSAPSGINPIHGHSYIPQGPTSGSLLGSPTSEPLPLGSCPGGPQPHSHGPPTGPPLMVSYKAQPHFPQTAQCNGSSYQGLDSSSHEAAVLEFLSKGRNPSTTRHSISPPRASNSHRLDRENRSRESCERSSSGKNGYRDEDHRDCSKIERHRDGWNINETKRKGCRKLRSSDSNIDKHIQRSSRRGSLDRSPDKSPQETRSHVARGRNIVSRKKVSLKSRRELESMREDVIGIGRKRQRSPCLPLKENKTSYKKTKDNLVRRKRLLGGRGRNIDSRKRIAPIARQELESVREDGEGIRRNRNLSPDFPLKENQRTIEKNKDSLVERSRDEVLHSRVLPHEKSMSHKITKNTDREFISNSTAQNKSTTSPVYRRSRKVNRNSPQHSPCRSHEVTRNSPERSPSRSQVRQSPVRRNHVRRVPLERTSYFGKSSHQHCSTSREDNHKKDINNPNTNFDKRKLKEDSPKFKSRDDCTENSEHEYEEVKTIWLRSSPGDLFYQKHDTNSHVTYATDMLKNLCQSMDDKMVQRGKKVREEKIKQREQEKIENEKLLESNVNDKGSVINPKESNINDKLNEPQEHSNNFKQNHLCDIDVNSSITDGTLKNSCSGEIVSISTIENKNDTKSNDPILTSRESSPNISKNEMVHNIHQSEDSSEMSVKPKISELSNEECEPGEVVSETENSVAIIQSCKSNHEHSHKHIHKKRHKRTKKFEYDTSSSDSSDSDSNSSSSSSSSSSSHSDEEEDIQAKRMKELERRKNHPDRLHEELWFNDPGEMNDGPLCRCSLKAQRSGIRHGFYLGEKKLEPCDPWSNNADRLHHYLVTISPPTNFLVKTPTVISHIGNEFIFEGFSLLSHHPLKEVPTCSVIRFNIEYTILYIEEKIPDNFCIRELDLFYDYLFLELLELVDLNLNTMGDTGGCPRFHFMPRFVRNLPDNGKEILSMNEVLMHILRNSGPLIPEEELAHLLKLSQYQWQNYADNLKGMVVTCPGMKPCSIRVDQLDRDQDNDQVINYPVIVHFGIRPPQLSYAGNPVYQKAWREYVKFRHLLANMPKPSPEDKCKLANKESQLQEMRMTSKMKRDVTVAVSSHGFYRTGIMCDVVQHAMLLPVLVCHLRFHQSLDLLTKRIGYKFHNRYLLQLALTHPSYRENFGTNPDHARNSLTNCSIRQPEYGDRRIHYMHTRKRGINTLINIMSRFGARQETESKITHNERLEFLGDAVVEFLSSIHLFHLFPNLEEGGLATYRAAIVQNQHLAVLAEKLGLDEFMLYAHGSDLCHDFELRHAMANCFEALMGAIFLDAGIEEADKVFSATLFLGEELEHDIWVNYPPHPLQEQEPNGDRKWMEHFPILKKLANYEGSIGVEFRHIRLLARVFTDRSIGPNNLTLGSNQRLEFLGDTVLQLVASEYLYKFFPEHHEGHLSLLRSSLVNNRTQAVVCDDLDMTKYAIYSELKSELKTKDRADLLEAFLGALYIDRGLDYCKVFCEVCFFPRLHQFIMNQDWNDPKSKLQQCCLTLRTMDGGEPDIPIYKVIECKGPTNTRVYTVAVYFRNKRLAKASGHSIQTAEMNAAKEALSNSKDLFPQLDHQRRVIEKSVKIQVGAHAHSLHADTQNNNDLKRREQDKDREKIKEKVRREGDISERAEHFREEEKRKRGSSKPKISEIRSDIVRDSRNRMRNNDKIEGEENRNRHSKFKNSKTSEPTSDINRDNIMRDNDNDSDISKREEYILDESRRNIHSNSKYSETRNNIQSDSGNRMMENDKSDSDLSERAEYTQEEKNKKHKSTCKYSKTRSEIHGESRNTMRDNNKSDRYGSGNEKLKQNSRYIGDSKYRKEICANGTLRKDSKLKSNENSRFRNTDTRRDNYLNAERSKDSSKYNDKSNIPFLHKEKSSYVKKQTRDSSKPKLYLWSGKDDNEKGNNYSDGKNLKTQRYSDFT